MSKVNATVTIQLLFDTSDLNTTNKSELVKTHLTEMVNRLSGDGAFSGYEDMTVDEWTCEVSAIEIP